MAEIVSERDYKFELPHDVKIYRLRPPEVSEQSIRRIGGRFGLSGSTEAGTFTLDHRSVAYAEASGWGLRVFRQSGGWQYRHASRWQADDGAGRLEIADAEAGRVALEALRRHDLPGEPGLQRARVERLHVAHAQQGGANHEERIVGARVLLRRMLDGLAVEGPGGRTVVYIDHKREVTGIDHLWRDIERVHAPVQRLRPVEEAIEEVRRRYAGGDGRVEVTDIRLAYYELGFEEQQTILQPAYVVFLRLGSVDARFRMNALVPVPAAVNAEGAIEPVRRVREPQARRAG